MSDSSNTAQKQQSSVPGKPFTKGDKRINRKGRPKSFDALRSLAQAISHEEVTNSKGETVPIAEAILRQWAASKDPRLQMKFVEVAFGNAPVEHKHKGDEKQPIEHRHSGEVKYNMNVLAVDELLQLRQLAEKMNAIPTVDSRD